MGYLSIESIEKDKIKEEDIIKFENLVKNALINELKLDEYLNLSSDEKLNNLFTINETGIAKYNILINGLPYASNIINVEDINNL